MWTLTQSESEQVAGDAVAGAFEEANLDVLNMAKTNDETEARRIARERRARLQEAERERNERIDNGMAAAVMSTKAVERSREELSQAEERFAAAVAEHEQRLGRIVAAFHGEKLNATSIAELLELTPREVLG